MIMKKIHSYIHQVINAQCQWHAKVGLPFLYILFIITDPLLEGFGETLSDDHHFG
jgi:hypothetical protein